MQRMKKATAPTAAEDKIQARPYHHRRRASTVTSSFFRPPHAATAVDPGLQRGDAETVEATGFLVLYLLSRPLPKPERALGWSLVEEWLAEVAQSRHVEHRGAA
jgi:hypothetical protein